MSLASMNDMRDGMNRSIPFVPRYTGTLPAMRPSNTYQINMCKIRKKRRTGEMKKRREGRVGK